MLSEYEIVLKFLWTIWIKTKKLLLIHLDFIMSGKSFESPTCRFLRNCEIYYLFYLLVQLKLTFGNGWHNKCCALSVHCGKAADCCHLSFEKPNRDGYSCFHFLFKTLFALLGDVKWYCQKKSLRKCAAQVFEMFVSPLWSALHCKEKMKIKCKTIFKEPFLKLLHAVYA